MPAQTTTFTLISGALLLIGLAACGPPAGEQERAATPTIVEQPEAVSVYAAAVDSNARPAADRARDAGRKPAEVLEFLGIRPGMTVLDLFTGGGYYAEILAGVVGERGRIIAQTNEAYLRFVGDEFEQRFGTGRLPNVEVLMAENNELDLGTDSLDAVMLVLSFHDLYYVAEDSGWPAIDRDAFLAELRDALRPGGIVGIVDHHGTPGVPAHESANGVHRIDANIVVADMQAAGFVLAGSSELLRSGNDDYAKSVFDDAVRGRTDRFVMRFESPD